MAKKRDELWDLLVEFFQICLDLFKLAGVISKATFQYSKECLITTTKYASKAVNLRVEIASPVGIMSFRAKKIISGIFFLLLVSVLRRTFLHRGSLNLTPRHKMQLADEDHVWRLHPYPGILHSLRIFPALFCNICSKSIRGFTDSVLRCQACGAYAHGRCCHGLTRHLKSRPVPPCKALCRQDVHAYVAAAHPLAGTLEAHSQDKEDDGQEPDFARNTFPISTHDLDVEEGLPSGVLSNQSSEMCHQWIHGNLDILQKCSVCDQFVGSDGMYVMRGWRCMWCEGQVHEACWQEVQHAQCELGRHRRLMLPPTCLSRTSRSHPFSRWSADYYAVLNEFQTENQENGTDDEFFGEDNITQTPMFSNLVHQIGTTWFGAHVEDLINESRDVHGDIIHESDWEDDNELDSTSSDVSGNIGNQISVQEAKFPKRIKKVGKRGQKIERYLQRYELLTDLVPEDIHPLLVLVNSKSGGQQGQAVLQGFKALLHPFQVWDVTDIGPSAVLRFFKDLPRLKVLVAGGDGTVGWILQEVEQTFSGSTRAPPVAILPLGTGNDLARMLKWGGGYTGGDLNDVLQGVANAHPVEVDRWNVNVTRVDGKEGRSLVMNNYLGIGIDGALSLDFHETRKANPNMFINRFLNKVMYGGLGFRRFLSDHGLLADKAEVYCDGRRIDFPPGTQGVICLNINSYAGGSKLWDEKNHGNQEDAKIPGSKSKSSLKDELVEVVAVQGLHHLGAIQVGLVPHATSIAQCHDLTIEIKNGSIPVQVDGEPWRQEPCTIEVRHRNQAILLEKTVDIDGEWLGRFEQIMFWAEREHLVPAERTNIILREAIKRWSHL